MRSLVFIFAILSSSLIFSAPTNFYAAKLHAETIFAKHPETLYCGCSYRDLHHIDLVRCGMRYAKHLKRAKRIEWEHMMPAEHFGKHFKCWQKKICRRSGKSFKGRSCCRKRSVEFNEAEAELYNIWPAVGIINQARSNYRFSPLETHQGTYGCDFEVDSKLRKVEPADRAKGIVARANLFMSDRYHIRLSKSQRQLFLAWNKAFPPSIWEKEWALEVAMIEGYDNPYITQYSSNSLDDKSVATRHHSAPK